MAATGVEFWQAAPSRVDTRLRYERSGDRWDRFRLWS
ncbi:pyridoxine 5'-phosphate oxidase C-terminal domain-containing protein [Streptomyces xanthophaeus]